MDLIYFHHEDNKFLFPLCYLLYNDATLGFKCIVVKINNKNYFHIEKYPDMLKSKKIYTGKFFSCEDEYILNMSFLEEFPVEILSDIKYGTRTIIENLKIPLFVSLTELEIFKLKLMM